MRIRRASDSRASLRSVLLEKPVGVGVYPDNIARYKGASGMEPLIL